MTLENRARLPAIGSLGASEVFLNGIRYWIDGEGEAEHKRYGKRVNRLSSKAAGLALLSVADFINNPYSQDNVIQELGHMDTEALREIHYLLAKKVRSDPEELSKWKGELGPNGIRYYFDLEFDR